MARTKKTSTNDEGGDQSAAHGPGHNKPELTDDERRVLLYGHRVQWEAAERAVVAAKAAKKAVETLAKAEYGPDAVADIKELILMDLPKASEALRIDMERKARLARWANLPEGMQLSFLDADRTPEVDRARELGKTAGLKGEVCKPPYDASVPQYNAWMEGWHAGQEVRMSNWRDKLKKTDETPAPDDQQTDLSERTDLGADDDGLVMTEQPFPDVANPPFNETEAAKSAAPGSQ